MVVQAVETPEIKKPSNKLTFETAVAVEFVSQPANADHIWKVFWLTATKVLGGETVIFILKLGIEPFCKTLVPKFPYIYHPGVLPVVSVVNADQFLKLFFQITGAAGAATTAA